MGPPFIVAPQNSSKQNGLTKSSNSKQNGRTKKPKIKSSINSKKSIVIETPLSTEKTITPLFKNFTFEELKSATMNFRADMMLGEGGFGKVFKGWVDQMTYAPSKFGVGIAVAIKKSNPESLQGMSEWESEVEFVRKLSHPNIIKLLGSCREDTEFLLVYEYMQNGSLDSKLFNDGLDPLPWGIRLKVAIGAARGLAFLHASERPVIFRDFKTTNILLDGDYNAKLSDFGLAMFSSTNRGTNVKRYTHIGSTSLPSNGNMQVTTQINWSNGDMQVTTKISGSLGAENSDPQVTTKISLPNGNTHVTTQITGMLDLTDGNAHVTTQIGGMLDPTNDDTHMTTHIKTCPANGDMHVTAHIRSALGASNGSMHVTTQIKSTLIPTNSSSQVTTPIMGTYGYAAPEYSATGNVYVKSDVYGFGVVFLELLTGLRALDINRPRGMQHLVEWAKPSMCSKRNVKKIMDPRLQDQYPPKGAFQAAQFVLKCLECDPRKRPSMKEVLNNLEQINAFKEENRGAQSQSNALSGPTPKKSLWKWDFSSFIKPCQSFLTRLIPLWPLVLL